MLFSLCAVALEPGRFCPSLNRGWLRPHLAARSQEVHFWPDVPSAAVHLVPVLQTCLAQSCPQGRVASVPCSTIKMSSRPFMSAVPSLAPEFVCFLKNSSCFSVEMAFLCSSRAHWVSLSTVPRAAFRVLVSQFLQLTSLLPTVATCSCSSVPWVVAVGLRGWLCCVP